MSFISIAEFRYHQKHNKDTSRRKNESRYPCLIGWQLDIVSSYLAQNINEHIANTYM